MTMQFELADYLNPVFVETGTFHGNGVRAALRAGFKKIISLEVFAPMVQANEERFSEHIRNGTVAIVHGDSGEALEAVLHSIGDNPITFWLDAHIQTQNGGGVGTEKCPVVAELRQIARARAAQFEDVILIDDLRLIEDANAGWAVNIGDMYRTLWDINRRFAISRLDGHVPHDVLCCRPA
ncbi:MAG: hypothetical protein AAGG11_08645 [Pseudomonadota bacterium]